MLKNLDTNRKIRIALGALIIIGGLIFKADWWVIGLFPLLTGVFNTCPSCSSGSCQTKTDK